MKIGIVALHLLRPEKHGVEIAALELIRSISSQPLQASIYIFCFDGPDRKILDVYPGLHFVTIPRIPYPVAEQLLVPLLAKRHQIELLHFTANTAALFTRIPIITTLHDVIFLEYSIKRYNSIYQKLATLYRQIIAPVAIRKAVKVITVSNAEVNAIFQFMPWVIHKTEVIPNAIAPHFFADSDTFEKPEGIDIPERYILFHGNRDPKKNMEGLLLAFHSLIQSGKADYRLLITDMDERKLNDYLNKYSLQGIRKHITLTGYVKNVCLPYIYKHALAFVYPSHRESFGLPLIEAMASGTPVISGICQALQETGGDAPFYIDSCSTDQIALAIDYVVKDEATRKFLIEKGKAHAASFDSQITGKSTYQTYLSVLKDQQVKRPMEKSFSTAQPLT